MSTTYCPQCSITLHHGNPLCPGCGGPTTPIGAAPTAFNQAHSVVHTSSQILGKILGILLLAPVVYFGAREFLLPKPAPAPAIERRVEVTPDQAARNRGRSSGYVAGRAYAASGDAMPASEEIGGLASGQRRRDGLDANLWSTYDAAFSAGFQDGYRSVQAAGK